MSFKLMLKNSWRKLKSNFRILGILFLYIFFAFSAIFGLFGLTSQLNKRLNLDPLTIGHRVDFDVNKYDLVFFSDKKNETEMTVNSPQYRNLILEKLNSYLDDTKVSLGDEVLTYLDDVHGSAYRVLKEDGDKDTNVSLNDDQKSFLNKWNEESSEFFGNIYLEILKTLIQDDPKCNDFKTQIAYQKNIFPTSEETAYINAEDFSNQEFRTTSTKKILDSGVDERGNQLIDIYLVKGDYEKWAGKNIDIPFSVSGGNDFTIHTKVVGELIDYTNVIRTANLNMAMDIKDYMGQIRSADPSGDYAPHLLIEDISSTSSKLNYKNIVNYFSNIGDVDSYKEAVKNNPDYHVNQISRNSNFVDYDLPKKATTVFQYTTILVVVLLVLLTAAIMFFMMKEFIEDDKKILYFLKTMGVKRSKLAGLTVMNIFYPIILAFACSMPMTFVIQHLLYNSVANSYTIFIPFFTTTWSFYLMIALSFVATMILFFGLVFLNVSEKSLSPLGVYRLSTTENVLTKFKPVMKKAMFMRNDLLNSFLIKNFYQNLVMFLIFTISIGLAMYGILFNFSVSKTVNDATNYFNPYSMRSVYRNSAMYLNKDDTKISHSYVYNEKTMDEEFVNDKKDKIRRIWLTKEPGNFKINYYDESGALQNLNEDTNFDKLNMTGRYMVADDVSFLIKNSWLVHNDDVDDLIKKVNEKIRTVKNYYPDYDGTSISFGVNYKDEKDSILSDGVSALGVKSDHVHLNWWGDIKTVSKDGQKLFSQYADLKTDVSRTNVNVAVDDSSTFANSIIPETPGTYPDFYMYNEFMKWNSDPEQESPTGFQMKNVPTIDVIVPKRERKYFKKHNQIVLTLVEDQKTNYRLYIPLYFNVLDYDVVIPTDEVVVSEQQLKSAVDELVDGVKDGLQTYEKQNAETNYKIFNDIFSEDFKFTLEYNTFFGNGVPRGYSNLVFSANGDPSKFESYGLSESVLNDYPVSIDDFASIGHAALNNLGPVLAIIKNITVFAFFIAVLVSILLIYLILKENNNIIAVLKIMGYRKRSITGYIITGYIISSVLASAAAVGVSFAGFGISAIAVENMFSYTFAIHINTAYIMTLITSPIAYLVIVWLSIFFATRKSSVKSIDNLD